MPFQSINAANVWVARPIGKVLAAYQASIARFLDIPPGADGPPK